MNNNPPTLNAIVKKIIFHSPESNFYVLSVKGDNGNETITGTFDNILENHEYEFSGDYKVHDKYGEQFVGYNAVLTLPKEKDAFISYLSSKQFTGVGKTMAGKIYDLYSDQDEIYQAIIDNPQLLLSIKGMSESKASSLIEQLEIELQGNILIDYLKDYTVDYNLVLKAFNKSGLDINSFVSTLKLNPYLLVKDNLSFKDVDAFAMALYEGESYEKDRATAYVFQTIKDISFQTGSTYITRHDLHKVIHKYYSYDIEANLEDILSLLDELKYIRADGKEIYPRDQFNAELVISRFINQFYNKAENNDYSENIEAYEIHKGITLNNEQKEAINNGLNTTISIVTGGPGTGKSTIVDAIIYILEQLGQTNIGLAAPTGKASKRLNELTNKEAMTIHRMLKYNMNDNTFGHHTFNPLEYKILIIDESSMIDNLLMEALLKACESVSKIIFLGDYNQLPSVAQGQVLKDLIDSKQVKTTYLKEIYRQKEGSSVIDLAYSVLNKEQIDTSIFNQEDLIFIDEHNTTEVTDLMKDYANSIHSQDSVVLAPIYRGRYGIDNLNKASQFFRFQTNDKPFQIDDVVIQLKNRRDDDIYNGDVGKVFDVRAKGMDIKFDHRIIEYTKSTYDELALAYAMSIHKSQGNEYDHVILFVSDGIQHFMDNKMLYTAITRAKKKLTIISNIDTLNKVIQNNIHSNRKTKLISKITT